MGKHLLEIPDKFNPDMFKLLQIRPYSKNHNTGATARIITLNGDCSGHHDFWPSDWTRMPQILQKL